MTQDHSHHDEKAKRTILENIKQFGCHLVLIEDDNYLPSFVYSIGLLQKFGHPEIICFGLKIDVMGSILNHACDLVRQEQKLETHKPYGGFIQGYDVQFIPVAKEYYGNYLGYAGWFYKTFDFPVLQLVWPDKQSNYPWDGDFNPDWKFRQPLLDRNTDFKFYEERRLGVYTTKQALEGDPILYVYHNKDGDWQFHTSREPDLNDAKLICLEEITKLDPTINDIYHLQYGWYAWRDSIEDEWQYEKNPDEE